MSDKLNLIARKIYEEGLEQAQAESKAIIDEANKKADQVLQKAKEEAEKIIDDAKQKAEKEKKISDSEIKLASNQLLQALRQEIKELIASEALNDNLKNAFEDQSFVKELMIEFIKAWNPESGLELKSQESLNKMLETALKDSSPHLLKKLSLKEDNSTSGFSVKHVDDGFIVEISEAQFEELLKPFIKENTHRLLFDN